MPTVARLYFPDDKRNMLLSIFGLSAYNRILFSITISTIGIIYLFVIDLKSCLIVNENLYLRKFILVRGNGYNTINQPFVLSSKELEGLFPGRSLTFFQDHQNFYIKDQRLLRVLDG